MRRSTTPRTTGSFIHGTLNLQKKATDSLGAILDCLDERLPWDAWSFQEVLRTKKDDDGDNAGNILVLKNVGKLGHVVAIGCSQQGSHSVAVAIHNRWANFVSDIHQGHRCIALLLQTVTNAGATENLQILSAHFPSAASRHSDEIAPSIAAWGALLRGHRRSSTITGVDASMEFTEAQAGRVGSAMATRRTRRTQQDEELKTLVYAELDAHDLSIANTFEELFNKMDVPLAKENRVTWRGKIFGNCAEGALDNTVIDKRLNSMIDYIGAST